MTRALTLLSLFWIASSQSALAQTLGQAQGPEIAWWRIVAALLLCLALGVAGAFALRARMGGAAPPLQLTWPFSRSLRLSPAPERRLKLVESLRLAPQASVNLVSCDGVEFLVAVAPHGMSVTPVSKGLE